MTNKGKVKPPIWFWIVSAVAFVWNALGVDAYLSEAYMSIEDLGKMSQAERLLFESQPAWVTAAFAIAVWGGALGCLALLLRKKWAMPILLVSLIGILAQMTHAFFMSNTFEVVGNDKMGMTVMIIIVGVALVLFARMSKNKGWIS